MGGILGGVEFRLATDIPPLKIPQAQVFGERRRPWLGRETTQGLGGDPCLAAFAFAFNKSSSAVGDPFGIIRHPFSFGVEEDESWECLFDFSQDLVDAACHWWRLFRVPTAIWTMPLVTDESFSYFGTRSCCWQCHPHPCRQTLTKTA
jgi:hypothetical protein